MHDLSNKNYAFPYNVEFVKNISDFAGRGGVNLPRLSPVASFYNCIVYTAGVRVLSADAGTRVISAGSRYSRGRQFLRFFFFFAGVEFYWVRGVRFAHTTTARNTCRTDDNDRANIKLFGRSQRY